ASRGVRPRHGVLRGRDRSQPDAPRVLLPERARHRGGDPPARGAPRRRGGAVPIAAPMRIAVLAGGPSLEREVSLRSGHRVTAALSGRGHDATVLDPAEVALAEAVAGGGYDACYIALHGKAGEDGAVQRLLELLGVPYT